MATKLVDPKSLAKPKTQTKTKQKSIPITDKVVDLESIVNEWALWKMEVCTTIPIDCLDLRVDWKRVKVTHNQPTFENVILNSLPGAQVLYRASFSNNTSKDQTHSFRTERVSRSTCVVIVEKGVSKSPEMDVQLKLPPEVLKADTSFWREVHLTTKAERETFEKGVTWSVDNNVTVPPGHRTTAELKVKEKQYSSSFTIISEAWGRVHVAVYDRRNNTFVEALDDDLSVILGHHLFRNLSGLTVDTESRVHFKTQGKCSFRYAVQQHVELYQEKLPTG